MKTLREILLEQHRSAVPELDAIRREIVARLDRRDAGAQNRAADLASLCLGAAKIFWHELFFPCRRLWTGLAVIWVLILVVNVSLHDRPPAGGTAKSSSTAGLIMILKDQQKILAELVGDRAGPADSDRPKTFSPKPRTERIEMLTV